MTNTSKQELQNLSNNETWTDTEWDHFRKWVVEHLKFGLVTVSFTKKDGSERIMECTLNSALIPEQPVVELAEGVEPKVKKENLNIVSVYDVKAQGWRSFTLRNVKQIQFDI